MRTRRPGGLAAAAVAAAVCASLAAVVLSLWIASADGGSLASPAASAAVVVAFVIVGAVVVSARPANAVGWMLLAGGAAWAIGSAGADAAHRGIVRVPGSVPYASALAVGGSAVRAVGWSCATIGVAMLVPDGRIAGHRWRWLPPAFLVAVICSVAGALTASDGNVTGLGSWRNPVALPARLQAISGILSLLGLAAGVVATAGAVAQLASRWRRGGMVARQQLTLIGVAAIPPIAAAPLVLAGVAGGWLFSAAALPLPFAIGVAVLAGGLYDLRTAANRTLVWSTLSAVVVGIYALVIAGLGGLLGAGGAPWLPWLAAAAVALSFAPLRDTLQRGVNRITFGRWDEPYEVLAGLAQRLEANADADGLIADVAAELRGLGLQEVAISDEHGHVLAGSPPGAPGAQEMTLWAYGRAVGTLCFVPPEAPLRPRDGRLLDDLAGQLGGVLHARQLTTDLHRAVERLVLAREEERRRLRRDLHDGLGPALASHVLRLDLIAGTLDLDPASSAALDRVREELGATMSELRRVVDGLRPPALDELGLAGALAHAIEQLTASAPLVVDLQVRELPPLPAAIEVATYRIVSEAVTNAVRHASATRCVVEIEVVGARVRISVRDDGRGLADGPSQRPGHGLETMRERAVELRGSLRVGVEGGTLVVAEIPLPPGSLRSRIEVRV